MDPEIERTTLTTAEAARLLGIGHSKFRQMVADGVVPSFRAGRKRLIPKAQLEDWVRQEIERTRADAQRRR